ncbi:MAG: hypothetical protein EBU93_04320, partial [Chlamydiae bacterium]|nr:hypothetical protein [Chlamydiota bacterium]
KKISIDESEFIVTDKLNSVFVKYKGALPMIFREEQGVVVIGSFDSKSKIFYAKSVLAKHDEKYKPKTTQAQTLN